MLKNKNCHWRDILERIECVLIEKEYMTEKHRIEYEGHYEVDYNTDWVMFKVLIYPPRKKKYNVRWELAINIARNIVRWDKSTVYFWNSYGNWDSLTGGRR